MTTRMITLSALVLCLYFLPVDGALKCQIRGKGRLSAYTSQKVKIRIPCKYEATTALCQGYRVHVAPTQAIDNHGRYYTKNVWVGIRKVNSPYFWRGRTTAKRVLMLMNGTEFQAFRVKEHNLTGAPFKLTITPNTKDSSVTVGVTDADWKVTYYAYDSDSKKTRKNNGVEIVCPDAQFDPEVIYPKSMCGNTTDGRSVRDRKKELGFKDRTQTIIYDILNSDMQQYSASCEVASNVFKNSCGESKNRVEVLDVCSPILTNLKIMKCLHKYSYHAMDVFLKCLKYKCLNDWDSCDLLQEAMRGCPALKISNTC